MDRGAENPISGGAETPVELFTVHSALWTIHCGLQTVHSNEPPYINPHFDEPQLLGTKQYNVRDAETDQTNIGLVVKIALRKERDVNAAKRLFANHQHLLITSRPRLTNHL